MKKLIWLLLFLPLISWAQVDSLELKKDSLGLEGKIPGLNINSINQTQPGYNFVCRIPPSRSYNENPLYVIDGEITNYENLSISFIKENIQSIKVIKGNEAISKYGQKGSYGVIEIETKDGNGLAEYDLTVLDFGYENFLKMQPSAGTYSLSYLQNKNNQYVSIWNSRVITGNPGIYEMPIDYDSKTYYGLEFEYKLYMFFKFMEYKHRISFNG